MTEPRTNVCPHCGGDMEQSMGGGWFDSDAYCCEECGVASVAIVNDDNSVSFVPSDDDENCCEHGDHPCAEGKRFCSDACERCEHESTGDTGCDGICGHAGEP